jgi:hypothetical protein
MMTTFVMYAAGNVFKGAVGAFERLLAFTDHLVELKKNERQPDRADKRRVVRMEMSLTPAEQRAVENNPIVLRGMRSAALLREMGESEEK